MNFATVALKKPRQEQYLKEKKMKGIRKIELIPLKNFGECTLD